MHMNHHFSRILLFSRFVGFLKSNWLIGCQPITVGESVDPHEIHGIRCGRWLGIQWENQGLRDFPAMFDSI